MSPSGPVRFSLLKLPFLCIEAVVKSWDIFDIIFFAAISKKTRRIVKNFKIPLRGIKLHLLYKISIELGMRKMWKFKNNLKWLKWFFDRNSRKHPLVLEKNTITLYTSRTNDALKSYFDGNEVTALKMAMEFLNEVFKCSVEGANIDGDNFPKSGDIGVKSIVNLSIDHSYGYAQGRGNLNRKLNLLLENLEVTGTCSLDLNDTENGFYVDPKLLKCKRLVFSMDSGAWVTREILLQFEVSQLKFYDCPFSVEDILSFVTNWFHSENKKLEYLYIYIKSAQFSLENFQTEELNPLPFSGRNRVPPSESDLILFEGLDFSEGLEVVRHDGLEATIHLSRGLFVFYIWHNQ